ncbi:ribonuclease Y [Patescibacteria group bacterium]|nr:ribonuclease Y [Patescibacteria group bacterium]MBU1673730.1 ribonuclease Y [Patescibacteria group bacterium]MBU1963097.1 ribonuclease Y [Patescibacteria group bacterium]
MESILGPILLVLGLGAGTGIGYWLRKQMAAKQKGSAEAKAEAIILEAKNKQQEALLEAKSKALKVVEEAKKEEQSRRQELSGLQKRLEKRESLFDQQLLDLENQKQNVMKKVQKVENVKKEVENIRNEQMVKLEKVASLTQEQGKALLLEGIERKAKEDLVVRMRKLENTSNEEIDNKAKQMLTSAIQRCASSHAAESTTTVVQLPSDDMKGRIIGREGRNIKRIEELTGVEIIVDDTPEAIIVSGFSPIRRHLAKRALDKLITDGRIHPTKIEDAIEASKKEMALDIKKAGEEAMYETGITGLDPKLVQILGRLKYRTSYGQNVLRHSVEVAHLSALLAEMLGANVAIAKKAGLLHDIGKAVDHEVQGTHPEIGRDIAKKFHLQEELIYPILEHHEDNPTTLEAVIVKVGDAISGARPGARKDTYEQYLQRLEELEDVANSFEGVDKTYAIQAGREVRIFVQPDKVDDLGAEKLAREIARKIEEELRYPGEIKVNVVRETRMIEFAR